MTSDPGAGMSFVSDPKKPVGGHVLAHASQTRVSVSFWTFQSVEPLVVVFIVLLLKISATKGPW